MIFTTDGVTSRTFWS